MMARVNWGEGTIRKILPKRGVTDCPHGKSRCNCVYRLQIQDENGNQFERRYKTYKEASDMRTKINDLKKSQGRIPGYLKGESPPFDEFAWEWLENRRDLAEGSKVTYRSKIANQLIPEFQKKPVGKINKADVEKLATRLYAEDVNKGNVDMIVSAILGGILDAAIKEDFRFDNPAREVELEPVPDAVAYLPETLEVWELADKIIEKYRLAVFLGSLAGLRAGEICAAGTECVRREGVFRVSRQWTTASKYAPPKGKREGEFREIPICDTLREEIERHCETFGILKGPFFPSPRRPGLPVGRSSFQDAFQMASIRVGNEKLIPHGLRHWFGTHMTIQLQDIAAVAIFMGHDDINTTFKRYYHLIADQKRKGGVLIGSALEAGRPVAA
ncbi:tyrosine-type recombinase/integrase [Nonomuraea sp. SYSU D8015]|uniref:tyrosine-type recombinase/integrase n=1 Tax=Nonomuraea sp. SYSU D8015 TaxID=2593644 RepID=UPI0016608490|nr:site-specific integrase [Nonomuraea sp. SYSU D8015]